MTAHQQAAAYDGNKILSVGVRVKIRETHNHSAQLTRYAVEDGNYISDHVIRNPVTVDVSYEMTNTDNGVDAAKTAYMEFVRVLNERKPLTLYTEHAVYRNMVMIGSPGEHKAPNYGTLSGTVRMQQAGFIGTQNIERNAAQGGRATSVLTSTDDVAAIHRTAAARLAAGARGMVGNASLVEKCRKRLIAKSREVMNIA